MGSSEKILFLAESIGILILNVNHEIPCKSPKFSLTTSFNFGKRLFRFSRLLRKSLAIGDVSEVLWQAPLGRKSGYRREREGIFPNRCALAQSDETTIQYFRISAGNQPFIRSGLDSFGAVFWRGLQFTFLSITTKQIGCHVRSEAIPPGVGQSGAKKGFPRGSGSQ